MKEKVKEKSPPLIKNFSQIETLNDISSAYRYLFKELKTGAVDLSLFREIRMALDGFSKNIEKEHLAQIIEKINSSEEVLKDLSEKIK